MGKGTRRPGAAGRWGWSLLAGNDVISDSVEHQQCGSDTATTRAGPTRQLDGRGYKPAKHWAAREAPRSRQVSANRRKILGNQQPTAKTAAAASTRASGAVAATPCHKLVVGFEQASYARTGKRQQSSLTQRCRAPSAPAPELRHRLHPPLLFGRHVDACRRQRCMS